jgi:hypothetical protein
MTAPIRYMLHKGRFSIMMKYNEVGVQDSLEWQLSHLYLVTNGCRNSDYMSVFTNSVKRSQFYS